LQPGFGTLTDILDAFPDELNRRREAYRPVTTVLHPFRWTSAIRMLGQPEGDDGEANSTDVYTAV
jgi:hypothetical protein